jgi:hypothetical protein
MVQDDKNIIYKNIMIRRDPIEKIMFLASTNIKKFDNISAQHPFAATTPLPAYKR